MKSILNITNFIKSQLDRPVIFFAILIFCIGIISYSFNRDWKLDDKRIPCDLRNRVVGARLLFSEDSPYFYKWNNSEPVTLYDFGHFRELDVNAVTVSPFTLLLIKPISGFSYFTISKIWLVSEYCCLLTIVFLSSKLNPTFTFKSISIISISLFTLSNCWQSHMHLGQYYIQVAFLFFIIYYILHRKSSERKYLILAGVLGTIIVLIRPVSALVLLPTIFIYPKIKYFFNSLVISGLLSLIIIFVIPSQRKLWQEHLYSIKSIREYHHGLSKLNFSLPPITQPENIEGYDMKNIVFFDFNKNFKEYTINYYRFPEEIGYSKFSMKEVGMHYSILLFAGLIFSFLLLKNTKDYNLLIEITFCLGFMFYIITEIFIPIHRASYNQAQWIVIIPFLILLRNKIPITLLLTVLFLALFIINVKGFDSQIISSELLALGTLALHSFMLSRSKKITDNP